MAWRPALYTATGGKIYIGSEIRDNLSLLDVVYANQFEGEIIDTEVAEQTEENFYRGAPPTWLNFHIRQQAKSDGTGTSFIKRDGYDTLVQQIRERVKGSGTSTIKLFHQQGCGGTTLAMQVLWDLRKKNQVCRFNRAIVRQQKCCKGGGAPLQSRQSRLPQHSVTVTE